MPIFPDIFKPSLDMPSIGCHNPRPITCDSTHSIYPIDFLNSLLEKIKTKNGEDDNTHTVRFLVDIYGRLWFAEEDRPSKIVPAHYQITGDPANQARCITAGNIKFSADHKEIIFINHKSSDFYPEFDTLKWALAILIANEDRLAAVSVRLADTINVQKLSSSLGSAGEPSYAIEKAELKTAVEGIFDIDKLKVQPTAIKETTYSIKRRRSHSNDEDEIPEVHSAAASSSKVLFSLEPYSPPRRPRGAGSSFFRTNLLSDPATAAVTEEPITASDAPKL